MTKELDLNKTLELAVGWAKQVGEIHLSHFRKNDLDIQTKSTVYDVVTRADKEGEAFLLAAIQRHFPDHSVLGEETGAHAGHSGWRWVIDPLDGTNNFSQGLPIFTVSIGLQQDGETVLGVVYAPRLEELYTAVKGGGAFLNGEPIRVSAKTDLAHAVLGTGFPYDKGINPDNVSDEVYQNEYDTADQVEGDGGWTTGKLLRTKEVWLCVFATGLLMLVQMGIMTQLVARNMEVGMNQAMATGVMSAIAVIGVIGSVIIGGIVFKLGIKKAGVMTCILYVVALLCNISGVMPLVWVSLVIIGFLGAAAPNLMNSIPGSVFGRVGYAKVNSVVFPITNIIFMCNFAVNGIVQGMFHSISAVYIVFAVLALISLFLILAIQDHKYDQDYMAAHKN